MIRDECMHCHEPIDDDHDWVRMPRIGPEGASIGFLHRNCFMRSVIGGVGHLKGECTCFHKDGTGWEDPPDLTKRQAADAAVALFEQQTRGADRN